MTTPIILFRTTDYFDDSEENAASIYFPVLKSRCEVKDSLVIAKYSCLPFYKELENDLRQNNSQLINSYNQHLYAADLQNWYEDLKEFTPKTWFRLQDVNEPGPYILKGETNSKKDLWRTHMFANNFEQAVEVQGRLLEDSVIGHQKIYVRKFENYKYFGYSLNGAPVTKEYRFFVCYGEIISAGFYWSNHLDKVPEDEQRVSFESAEFVRKVAQVIGDKINFYAIDIAQKADKSWSVVELNDGQMAGLSCNNPKTLYRRLYDMVTYGKIRNETILD